MSKKQYCLATITDKDFVGGTMVLIHSFLKHNKWFKGDLVIFTNDLDEKEKTFFDHFPNLRFENIDPELDKRTEDLAEKYERFRDRKGQFYSLNAFKLVGYDRVLFLDSDLLFRGSFKDLFAQKGDLLVSADAYYYKGKVRDPKTFHKVSPKEAAQLETVWADTFNSGMMMIDRNLLTMKNFREMVNMVDPGHFSDVTSSHSDQMILNQYFRGQFTIVSATYNYRFVVAHRIKQKEGVTYDNCKAVHFTARKKPWVPLHALRSLKEYPDYQKSFVEWTNDWQEVLSKI